ncbi:hypothetical protein M404DRAFT_131281 [Pisolithus tinctorius Marx 270]|uniref:Uncharacterized protein n=1 Tax=Pisolithus tinctorius Marx 270 TaxID=870435 RepID=A0A0C3PMG6_PISTI|nr:hypothetical protein M404DRAFT_131281 [Pisolithus tinctorius Marx 270]
MWSRVKKCPCALIEVYICTGKITRGTDNHLYLVDGSQIPHFPECNSLRGYQASTCAVTPAAPCNTTTQGTANLFCIAHPKVDVPLEIQPSAFLNTIQDVNEPVTDLADPNFQAYVTQAWATYQADKGNKGAVISHGKKACFDGASEPSAPAPTSSTTKPYVPLANPAPMPTHKDPIPMAIVPSQTPYPAAHNQNQYHYLFPLKDEAVPKHIMECVLETSIALPVKELFAVAPEFCKQFRDITMAKCITTNEIEVVCSNNEEGVQVNELTSHNPQQTMHEYRDCIICSDNGSIVAHHTLLLHCIKAKVPRTDVTINCILDSSLETITMPRCIWEKIRLPLCYTTVGILENLKLDFRARPVMLQVQVIEHANFNMLLSHPFICLMSAVTNDYPNSGQQITLHDPKNGCEYTLPTHP